MGTINKKIIIVDINQLYSIFSMFSQTLYQSNIFLIQYNDFISMVVCGAFDRFFTFDYFFMKDNLLYLCDCEIIDDKFKKIKCFKIKDNE